MLLNENFSDFQKKENVEPVSGRCIVDIGNFIASLLNKHGSGN